MDTAILESFAIVISSCDLFAMTTVAKLSSKLWNKGNVIGRYFKEFISMESTNWLLEYSSCYHLPVTHQPIFSSSNGAVVQPMLFSISECCSVWYKKLYESVYCIHCSPPVPTGRATCFFHGLKSEWLPIFPFILFHVSLVVLAFYQQLGTFFS